MHNVSNYKPQYAVNPLFNIIHRGIYNTKIVFIAYLMYYCLASKNMLPICITCLLNHAHRFHLRGVDILEIFVLCGCTIISRISRHMI